MENQVSILTIDDEIEVGEILSDIMSKKCEKVRCELERRKAKLYLDDANREVSKDMADKQKKMIGLLHVVNAKKGS